MQALALLWETGERDEGETSCQGWDVRTRGNVGCLEALKDHTLPGMKNPRHTIILENVRTELFILRCSPLEDPQMLDLFVTPLT